MPKPTLDAKQVLDDVRAGLDDAALMDKYNLSIKGLHSLLEKMVTAGALNESAIWISRSAREAASQPAEREVSAKLVVADIRAGVADSQLMAKYRLSAKGLQNLFEQLMAAGLIKDSDLEQGNPPMEHTVELGEDVLPPVSQASSSAPIDAPSAESSASPAQQIQPAQPPLPETEADAPTVESVTERLEEPPGPDRQEAGEPVGEEAPYADTIPLMAAMTDRAEEASPAAVAIAEKAPEITESELEDDRTIEIADDSEIMASLEDQGDHQSAPTHITVPEMPAMQTRSEEASAESSDTTVQLGWNCPACGKRQARVFDTCPECGVQVGKVGELQRKVPPPDTVSLTRAAETPRQGAGSKTAPERTVLRPVPPRSAKPAEADLLLDSEGSEPSSYSGLAWLVKGLEVAAVAQFGVMALYAMIQAVLSHMRGDSWAFSLWELTWPGILAIALYLAFRAGAAALRLGIDIADAVKNNNRLLRKILELTADQRK
jgi:hypothetical protein